METKMPWNGNTDTKQTPVYTMLRWWQVVIAKDEEDLSYMVRKPNEEYTKMGLEINIKNTEYLAIRDGRFRSLSLIHI